MADAGANGSDILVVSPALAARYFGCDVDRSAMVFQLRFHADHGENSHRVETGVGTVHHPGGVVLVPLVRDGDDYFGYRSRIYLRLPAAGLHARRNRGVFERQDHYHRHWDVARHHHVVQRLVSDLAEPAESPEY